MQKEKIFFQKITIIAAVALVAAIGGGFGLYEYYLAPKGAVESLAVIFQENKNIFFGKDSSKLGPKGMYLKIKEEIDAAQNLDELMSVIQKYEDKSQAASLEEKKEEIANLSEAQKAVIFSMTKAMAPSLQDIDIKNIKEKIRGRKATLQVSSGKFSKKGEVIFVKESGVWKIQQESWK